MKHGCLIASAVMAGLTVVGLAVGLFRAVAGAREAARRSQCISNCKWIVIHLLNYESEHGSFPPGTIPNESLPPERRLSWVVALWPMQRTGVDLKVDETKGWNEPPNWPPKVVAAAGTTFVDMRPEDTGHWVACPDEPAAQRKVWPLPLGYVGIAGLGADAPTLPRKHPRAGVFGYDRATKISEITDGTSQTMIVVETARGQKSWTAGGPSSVRGVDPATRPYIGSGRPFGGYHPGGTNVAMADGSVRFVRDSIAPKVFEALSTIAGGEVLPMGWDQ